MADMAVRFRSGPVARSDNYPTPLSTARRSPTSGHSQTSYRATIWFAGPIGSAGHVRNPELTTLGQTVGSAEPMAGIWHSRAMPQSITSMTEIEGARDQR